MRCDFYAYHCVTFEWVLTTRGPLALLAGGLLAIAGAYVSLFPMAMNLFYWAAGRLTRGQFTGFLPGMAVGLVIGLPLLALGSTLAAYRVRFQVDGTQLTRTVDLVVYRRVTTYRLADFEGVRIEGHATRGPTDRASLHVLLVFKTKGHLAVAVEPVRNLEATFRFSRQLAAAAQLPLDDRTARFLHAAEPPPPVCRFGRIATELLNWLL